MTRIATLTLNPCLDKNTWTDRVRSDAKLRCSDPEFEPGGGGINTARAAHRLGADATAVYLMGGNTGRHLRRLLDDEGVPQHPIEIEPPTRENLNVFERDNDARQFRFIMPGPTPPPDAVERCIDALLDPRDGRGFSTLVLSGSGSPDTDPGIYTPLVGEAHKRGVAVLLDASGELLRRTLEHGVTWVKPNLRELGELVGREIEDDHAVRDAARGLIDRGWAQGVIVSVGRGGAVLVTAEQWEQIAAPTVKTRSKIGAGDSMVGGIVTALGRGEDLADAVRYGVAAGAAAVRTPGTQLCERRDVDRLYHAMREGGADEPAGDVCEAGGE